MIEVTAPRMLFVDIETLPNQGFTWGLYDQNVIEFTQQSCLATWVAKWAGDKKIISKALPDYKGYTPGSYDDKALVADLWKLFDEADILVAHNGNSFDVKVATGRFILHGMKPPSPFKTIDTKNIAKEVARFNSNKLDDLCGLFNLGRKVHTDFSLWRGCINGDMKSWNQMVKYNRMDVLLLEKLYYRLAPFAKIHPNLTFWTGGECPKCGSSNVQYRGIARCITRVYRRFQCNECGSWGRVMKSEKGASVTTTNVPIC